jgi:hypothetical protein
MRGFLIKIFNIYPTGHPDIKGGTTIAVRKGIPHNHVDLPPVVSVDATTYLFVTVKSCLQLVTNFRAVPGVMLISLSSEALDVNLYWQVI